MYVSSFCGYLHHLIWHEEWLPYRWCGIASRFSLRDTGSSLLDDTAYAKHFFLWLIVFALSILLYFSFCKAYRLFVKFLNVWFLSLHFCMSAFAYNLTLCMVLVSSSITKVFTLCPLFSILLRIFTAIDGSIDFELPSQFFLQSYFFFQVCGAQHSYIFCMSLPLRHSLPPFEFCIQSLIRDLKKCG